MNALLALFKLIVAVLDLFAPPPVKPDPAPPEDNPDPKPPAPPTPPAHPLPSPLPPSVIELQTSLLVAHNRMRKEAGINSMLLHNVELAALAQKQAEYQASIEGWRNLHARPNGGSLTKDLKTLSFAISGGGENAAAGYNRVADVMQGWKNSRGHYQNIIRRNYTLVGFGFAKSKKGVAYWVAIFVD
jgi:uncharacterized protein YkwD